MYDELDDKFQNIPEYRNSIISLIKCVDNLNSYFLDIDVSCKIMIFLREDIFNLLNYVDLNKIKMDSALMIDWGTNMYEESPLYDLVLNKVRNSYDNFSTLDKDTLHKKLFDHTVVYKDKGKNKKHYVPILRYILTRTLLRPRDLITYLNLIIKKYPYKKSFSGNLIAEIEKSYSCDYFFHEIRNELLGHLSEDDINKFFTLLSRYGRVSFYFKDLEKYYNDHKQEIGDINIDKLIKSFYKFSVVGNSRYNYERKRTFYNWYYRDGREEIVLEDKIVIHHGLRKYLNLY